MENIAENVISLQSTIDDSSEERKEQLATIDFKMVAFSLAGKDYAIDIMKVKEIAKAGRFTYVPNTAPYVLGVYNLRGDIIPIIDLRIFFNIDVPERTGNEIENMIIVGVGDQSYGVVIDVIDKVVGIQKSTIQPPHPLFGDISIKYISGVIENNDHLYILLDIDRIFGVKSEVATEEQRLELVHQPINEQSNVTEKEPIVKRESLDEHMANIRMSGQDSQSAPAVEKENPALENQNSDYEFVIEGLKNFKKFYVTNINVDWVRERFNEWKAERGINVQIMNVQDADDFLKSFYSECTASLWSEQFANQVYKMLPDNNAKLIQIWNPGCGKGLEAYSLACLLHKRYPDSRIRIYAHDIDLLSVSNAPLLTMPETAVNTWYKDFLTKTASGAYTFIQAIKDIILFEYHDCMNTNAMPPVDMIFSRDTLSFLPESSQQELISDFKEKMKGNGILVIGKNEKGSQEQSKLVMKQTGLITVYTK